MVVVMGLQVPELQWLVVLVVDVSPEIPDETLYFALKTSGLRVFRAGDCVAPRYLSHAILEGYRAGREA